MPTNSTSLSLGGSPPLFSLPDVTRDALDTLAARVTLDDVRQGGALLVMFLCRHCPYVKHVEAEVARLGRDYAGRLGIVAISANDSTTHPEDAPSSLKEQAAQAHFVFPYLYDETQAVARAYGAVCTPDFFLFDAHPKLVYHGRLDATRVGREPATGVDLRAALDAVLSGARVSGPQSPSVGCSIKWKRG